MPTRASRSEMNSPLRQTIRLGSISAGMGHLREGFAQNRASAVERALVQGEPARVLHESPQGRVDGRLRQGIRRFEERAEGDHVGYALIAELRGDVGEG